jgi:DNA repair protein RadA/Sms
LLVEVQALVDASPLSNPRRVTLGLEQNRLAMLLAVLHRHGGVGLRPGRVRERGRRHPRAGNRGRPAGVAGDAVLAARRPLADKTVAFGEVGLSGEIRPVPNGEERLQGSRHPRLQARDRAQGQRASEVGQFKGLEVIAVERLAEALALAE